MAKFANGGYSEIYYELIEPTASQESQPPTLTLLHNIMSTGRTAWGRMVPKLAERYRILLPDLPGHGRSSALVGKFNYPQMAEQIADLMAAESASDGHLLGCSAGGMIAQHLVHKGLVNPATLTLVSTSYSTASEVTNGAKSQDPDNFQFGNRWLEATAKLHDEHHYAGYFQEVIVPAYRAMTPTSAIDLSLSDLENWQMPVCIIHGEHDEFFPISIVKAMANTIPNARLHIVPEQTHALIFRRSWQVLEFIEQFLPE